jgi:membrane protein YdbS with pleckstrin-like domain
LNEQPGTPAPGTAESGSPPAELVVEKSRTSPAPIADGRFRQLDPRSVQVARISGGITSAILAGVSLIGLVILLLAVRVGFLGALLLAVGWLLLAAVLGTSSLFWPGLSYRHASYRVDPMGLRIRRGVVWRSETSVPKSRIQHTDVSQGPIERGFGLATLIVHTAGTENASVSLGGLTHETALGIRDFLIEVGDDDAV